MRRKALGIVFLCLVLLVAILLGYWDMLNSEKLRISQTENSPVTGKVAATRDDMSPPRSGPVLPAGGEVDQTERAKGPAPSSGGDLLPDKVERIGQGLAETVPAPEASAKADNADVKTEESQPADAAIKDRDIAANSAAKVTADGATARDGTQASPPASERSSPRSADEATTVDPPRFDLLRVEPDGSTLIAGRSAPGSRITLHEGQTPVGEDTANATGEFVVVLPEPLPPGEHTITITATTPEGVTAGSSETAVVSVPRPGQGEDVLAMVDAPDKASRLMTVPMRHPTQSAGSTSPQIGSTAGDGTVSSAPQDEVPTPGPAAGSEKPDDTKAVMLPKAVETVEKDKPAGAATLPMLRIEAVEVEGEKIFVAGAADADASVRVYLDNILLAEGRSSSDNRFLVTGERQVAVGEHLVRADQVTVDGKVTARAEVPFTRPEGRTVAAVAPMPAGRTKETPGSEMLARRSSPAGPIGEDSGRSMAPGRATKSARVPKTESPSEKGATTPDPRETGARAGTTAAAPTIESPRGGGTGDGGQTFATTPEKSPADATRETAASAAPLAVPTKRQAPLRETAGRVIIRKGDTLWEISRNTYGRGSRYTVIYFANGNRIRDPNLIYPGQVFRLPDLQDAASGE